MSQPFAITLHGCKRLNEAATVEFLRAISRPYYGPNAAQAAMCLVFLVCFCKVSMASTGRIELHTSFKEPFFRCTYSRGPVRSVVHASPIAAISALELRICEGQMSRGPGLVDLSCAV